MTTALPTVSFVIPTFNSARTLAECLRSVRGQRWNGPTPEIVIADAGSTDGTRDIAREFKVDQIVENPRQTGEAGKSVGIRASHGDLVALVDSDNILDDESWLTRMTAPFANPEIMAAEPLYYTRRPTDPALTRYFAMLGMSDPLCLFLGNYDRFSGISGRWTDLPVAAIDRGDWLQITLDPAVLPTIGANGFVIRRQVLDALTWEPYFFDIDVVHQAVAAGYNTMAKVKCGIVHLYGRNLRDFARKQDRRIKDYLFFAASQNRSYPWDRQKKAGILHFIANTLLVLPLVSQILRGWRRIPDRAWWLHIPACWITLALYSRAVIARKLGFRPKARSRADWRQ